MMALLAAGFAACSDEEETLGGKDIQFAEGTSSKIEVYADETAGTAEGGISFTTTGAWRATVTPVTKAEDAAGTENWVQVVPDHGDAAGDYTIQVVLGVNATGEDRSATITITCGTTTITITVTQKGTTEDGKVPEEGTDPVAPVKTYPHLVSKIEFAYIPSRLEYSQEEELNRTYEFEYDGENRISGYSMKDYSYYGDVNREISGTLDYSTAGEIRVSERGFEGGDYTLKLNDAGYIDGLSGTDSISRKNYTFEYDATGHLTKQSWDGGKNWMTLEYNADGVISGGIFHEGADEDIAEEVEGIFGTDENDQLNVDVNMLFLDNLYSYYNDSYVNSDTVIMGRLDRLGFLRLLGKGADKYVIEGGEYDETDSVMEMPLSDEKPGTVYPESGEYTITLDDEAVDYKLEYEFDGDKSIKSISYKRVWAKYEYTKWYQVMDEVAYEDENGTKWYRVKQLTDRYTEEEVDRDEATYIYRFEYK